MYSALSDVSLSKPEFLGEEFWEAIDDALQRAKRAHEVGDKRLLIGASKELAESVARATLSALGDPAPSNEEFTPLLKKAHRKLAKQPGDELPDDSVVGKAAHASRSLAISLAEMRNHCGTGHGRATLPGIHEEVVEMSVFGALLWSRWSLRRLDTALQGAIEPLISDLRNATFYRENLARRLRAADLASLPSEDQRQLGMAVGQRAAMDTMTVTAEGVAACAEEADLTTWPVPYRLGVVEGLLLDIDGYIRVGNRPLALDYAVDVLEVVPDDVQAEFAGDLCGKVIQAGWSPGFGKVRFHAAASLRAKALVLCEPARERWRDMACHLEQSID